MFHLNMNFGKSIKKLTSEFNVLLSKYKSAGPCKTNFSSKALEFKSNEYFRIPIFVPMQNTKLADLYKSQEERFNAILKNDVPLQKKIQEPGKIINIKIKLPVGNLKNKLDLPCSNEKEIQEPVANIISKRANSYRNSMKEIEKMHIVNIRRRKMRIHKRKKYMRKHKVELMKKKADRKLQKEYDFQMQLKAVIKNYESFSPEEYLNKTLETVHWQRPVTKVRGILAPQWVIKDHLSKKEEEKILQQRLENCINSKN